MASETKTIGTGGWIQAVIIGRKPEQTLKRLALIIGPALVIFIICRSVLLPVRITGPSMFPTFENGQINFINRLAYLRHEPRRGDIVGIRFSGNDIMYVKRIVGLPGERVAFVGGNFCINGQPLPEPYLKYPSADWESPARLLGPQEYYVVGDNRSMSFENHDKGGAERRRIIGKILIPGKSQ